MQARDNMTEHTNILCALAVSVLVGCGSAHGQTPVKQSGHSAIAKLGVGFVSSTANVNGAKIHYVRGGTGPAVFLVHGFPQDWYTFHKIMPRLAKSFTVIAVDTRGVGGSTAPSGGFDATNIAGDIHQLARHLKLEQIYVAGHDNGGMVAYTYARLYPAETRGVMILDAPLPGIEPWEEIKANPALWHFAFHQTPELPEKLVAGRQFIYFREFFNRLALNRQAVPDADVMHYARAYAALRQLQAGLEFYRRAYPTSEKFNAAERGVLDMPIVLAGGDHAMGRLVPRLADALRKHGCTNVTVELVKDSGHWVVDEQPEIVAQLIERHASQ